MFRIILSPGYLEMRFRIQILVVAFMLLIACSDKVEVEAHHQSTLQAFPSPMNSVGSIFINHPSNEPGTLKVFDPKGKIILEVKVNTGEHRYEFIVTDKPPGKYEVIFVAGSMVISQTMIKI